MSDRAAPAATGFRRVRRRSVAADVSEQLMRRLLAGEYQPGERLPGHRDLAVAFGVSVTAVREALSALEARGLVESRAGSGTYAADLTEGEDFGAFMLRPTDEEEYRETLEARGVLETALARFAARRATADRVERLAAVVDEMEANAGDADAFLESDLAFHISLAEAAGNRALQRAMLVIRSWLRHFMRMRSHTAIDGGRGLDVAIADHRAVVEAIRVRDEDAAATAVDRIIQRGLDELHLAWRDAPAGPAG